MSGGIKSKLIKLRELHELGLLTEADFQKQKDSLLAAVMGTTPAAPSAASLPGATRIDTPSAPFPTAPLSGGTSVSGMPTPAREGVLAGVGKAEPMAGLPSRLGNYRVLEIIGTGGMGTVVRARHDNAGWALRQGGDVALKLIHPHIAVDPSFQERFFDEAELGRRVHHPGLARVYDVVSEGPWVGTVLEYIEGEELSAWVRPGGIPVGEVVSLLTPLAEALDHLHAQGIVHRDLKPANVKVRPDGRPVLLDLGIAKDLTGKASNQTKTMTMMGTSAWMAPEQADAKSVTPAADVYALGLIVYALLSGQMPWGEDATEVRIIANKLMGKLAPLSEVTSGVPTSLAAAVMGALSVDVGLRPSSCVALVESLNTKRRVDEPVTISIPSGSRTAVVVPSHWPVTNALFIRGPWTKKVGESIQEGECLVEVEGDWGCWGVPSPVTGVLVALDAEIDDEVILGSTIAHVQTFADAFQVEADRLRREATLGEGANELADAPGAHLVPDDGHDSNTPREQGQTASRPEQVAAAEPPIVDSSRSQSPNGSLGTVDAAVLESPAGWAECPDALDALRFVPPVEEPPMSTASTHGGPIRDVGRVARISEGQLASASPSSPVVPAAMALPTTTSVSEAASPLFSVSGRAPRRLSFTTTLVVVGAVGIVGAVALRRGGSESLRDLAKQSISRAENVANAVGGTELSVGPVGIVWVTIPAGTFDMGDDGGPKDEQPRHTVAVPEFEIMRSEVTVGEYRACVEAAECSAPDGHASNPYCNWGATGREEHPINCVDWDQAQVFAAWVGGRLPSEVEWEYAARGGARSRLHPWGNEPASCVRAVMDDGGEGCGQTQTWPACSVAAGNSANGICDLAGNVQEWVQDTYHGSYRGAPADGSAWEGEATSHVVRGGSWGDSGEYLRATFRRKHGRRSRLVTLGFRLAR